MKKHILFLLFILLIISCDLFKGNGGDNEKFVLDPEPNISATQYFAIALKADGSMWIWGTESIYNHSNFMSPKPYAVGTDETWARVAAGKDYFLAINTDGSLWAWGNNTDGRLKVPSTNDWIDEPMQVNNFSGKNEWKDVVAHNGTNAALHRNGSIWTWGGVCKK